MLFLYFLLIAPIQGDQGSGLIIEQSFMVRNCPSSYDERANDKSKQLKRRH